MLAFTSSFVMWCDEKESKVSLIILLEVGIFLLKIWNYRQGLRTQLIMVSLIILNNVTVKNLYLWVFLTSMYAEYQYHIVSVLLKKRNMKIKKY